MFKPVTTSCSCFAVAEFTDQPSELKGFSVHTRLVKGSRGFGFNIVGGSRRREFLQIYSITPGGPSTLHTGNSPHLSAVEHCSYKYGNIDVFSIGCSLSLSLSILLFLSHCGLALWFCDSVEWVSRSPSNPNSLHGVIQLSLCRHTFIRKMWHYEHALSHTLLWLAY